MKVLFIIALTAAPTVVSANCVPPFMPVFDCKIMTADQRVEICATPPDEHGVSDTYSYNFASGLAISELYFETQDNRFSTKYFRADHEGANMIGLGLVRGDHVYSVHLTEIDGRYVSAAQLHVYDSIADFNSERGEAEALRLYCEPGSVRVNWDFIRP